MFVCNRNLHFTIYICAFCRWTMCFCHLQFHSVQLKQLAINKFTVRIHFPVDIRVRFRLHTGCILNEMKWLGKRKEHIIVVWFECGNWENQRSVYWRTSRLYLLVIRMSIAHFFIWPTLNHGKIKCDCVIKNCVGQKIDEVEHTAIGHAELQLHVTSFYWWNWNGNIWLNTIYVRTFPHCILAKWLS